MKKSKFSDSQIMAILKQAEARIPALELCREHVGMSDATFHKWRSKYGGMYASMIARSNRYRPGLSADNCIIADWLLRSTHNQRNWSFGLCFLYLRTFNITTESCL